jgi:predicted murein hydrolase (TIGR00659 family)
MMLYAALPLTVICYWLTRMLYQKYSNPFLNPLLISMILLMVLVHFGHFSLTEYRQGTWIIDWLLKPAVVALALPLYQQMSHIRSKLKPIFVCCSLAVILSVGITLLSCHLMHVGIKMMATIAPRSITTPLAMSVSDSLGGIPSITAAVVVIVGISGAVVGFPLLKLFKVTDPQAQGIAIGGCSHAVGTAAATERGLTQGAFSSLSLVVCGVLTSIIAPIMFMIYRLLFG